MPLCWQSSADNRRLDLRPRREGSGSAGDLRRWRYERVALLTEPQTDRLDVGSSFCDLMGRDTGVLPRPFRDDFTNWSILSVADDERGLLGLGL